MTPRTNLQQWIQTRALQVRSILFRKRLKQISADFRFGPIWLILDHFKPPGAQPSGFRDSGRSLHSKGTHFSKPIFPTFSTTLGTTSPVNIIQKKIKAGGLPPPGPPALSSVASLRDPCPESPKMVGYTFYFMPRTSQNGRRSRPFWAFRA